MDIALRPAVFADETRPASILTVVSGAEGIECLRDSDGKDVPIAQTGARADWQHFPDSRRRSDRGHAAAGSGLIACRLDDGRGP